MEQNPPSGRRATARRLALIIAVCIAFGIVMAWIKGNGAGLSDAVGNISALWLLLPFLAGVAASSRRVILAALYGLIATIAAGLIAASFVLEPLAWWLYGLHIGGGAAYPVPGIPALWLSEIAIGVAGCILLRRLAGQQAGPG